jgi:large subunit ribosomal protein L13
MTKHVIDAKNKPLGRVATQAAAILMGKNSPSFARNVAPEVEVEIINASKTAINEQKKIKKTYITHSGYPGGQKEEALGLLIARKGMVEVYRRAVEGMLPKNKLQSRMINRLTVTD